MSRSRAPSRQRLVSLEEAKANAIAKQARKRVWAKPERIVMADRYGNIRLAARKDSTIGCCFEAKSSNTFGDFDAKGKRKNRKNGPVISMKPVGHVDERWTPELKEQERKAKKAYNKMMAAVRKMPDGTAPTAELWVALGKMCIGNANNMVSEHGQMVNGPHILAKFLTEWNKKIVSDDQK